MGGRERSQTGQQMTEDKPNLVCVWGVQRVILFWVYLCGHESVCKYASAVPMEARGELDPLELLQIVYELFGVGTGN